MTHEFFASADDCIEEELHAEGIRHGLALKWQDTDGATQRRLSIECAGFFVGTDETEVKTLGEICNRLIAVDATTLEDDDTVDELLKISYLVRADDDCLLFAEVTSYGAAEFSLRRDVQSVVGSSRSSRGTRSERAKAISAFFFCPCEILPRFIFQSSEKVSMSSRAIASS